MAPFLAGAYVGFLVEDKDPLSIQNSFRMDGFKQLKVCALGYQKIHLWSETAGEVKEVVEKVGWWCYLFEKVVPWTPELVTDERVTWLRCYEVPLHAWGTGLFRTIAFKFGRFIDVDTNTKRLVRCDTARVSIVTSENKLIDSCLLVTVRGKRFQIRVIEETGGVTIERRLGGVFSEGREDDVSSKASSDGGASVVGAMVGFSESGSDADVSDSCEVLLELEKRGREGLHLDGNLGREKPAAEDVLGFIPHVLGKSVGLVEKGVNFEVDKEKGICVESAGGDRVLEYVDVGSLSDTVKVSLVDRVCPTLQGRNDVEGKKDGLDLSNGSAQFDNGSPVTTLKGVSGVEKRCSVEGEEDGGPKILRTRLRDLWVGGSSKRGNTECCDGGTGDVDGGMNSQNTPNDSIESFGDQQVLVGGANQISAHFRNKGAQKKKQLPVLNNTNLPLSMLRKLPGSIHAKRKGSNRRKGAEKSIEEVQTIHEVDGTTDLGENFEETSTHNEIEDANSTAPISGQIMEGGGFIAEDDSIAEEAFVSHEVHEVEILIDIGEAMGINFHGDKEENVARMIAMEERDQAEKEVRENINGYQ
jgi:hypothetical protein